MNIAYLLKEKHRRSDCRSSERSFPVKRVAALLKMNFELNLNDSYPVDQEFTLILKVQGQKSLKNGSKKDIFDREGNFF